MVAAATLLLADCTSGADDGGVQVFTHPTLADADGDGIPEIYVAYGDGRVARLSHSGG